MIGGTLGHYRITAKIGAGGMGEVYRAHDDRLDRDVAIKILPTEVADDPDRLARFEREAKALAQLTHPNILQIFEFGEDQGVTFAVTELLEGETLRFEHKFIYTGLNLAFFQLPDNYRPYTYDNHQLSYYYSMGGSIGNKFAITKKISAFIEFGLFPFFYNHILPGSPIYDTGSDSDRFLNSLIESMFLEAFEAGLLPYKGLDINIGVGMGF